MEVNVSGLNLLPAVGNISNTGTLGMLLFVFIYSISLMISKIVSIQTKCFLSVKNNYSKECSQNYVKTTKNPVFPTNIKKKLCFWNFVGFSRSGALCSKPGFLVWRQKNEWKVMKWKEISWKKMVPKYLGAYLGAKKVFILHLVITWGW